MQITLKILIVYVGKKVSAGIQMCFYCVLSLAWFFFPPVTLRA